MSSSSLHLLNFNEKLPINSDLNNPFLTSTYRQLIIGSKNFLKIYDLSSILFREKFSDIYEVITIPNEILALTASIDRIVYVYCSKDNCEQLKICTLSFEEQELIIPLFDRTEPIHLGIFDDGDIYLGYQKKIYWLKTGNHWSFDSNIKKLCCGKEHGLILFEDGRVFSWGNGLHGALGHGDLEPCQEPKWIEILGNDVKDIVAGGWHSLALLNDGSVMSWGWNIDGSLGLDRNDVEDITGVFCDPTLVTNLPLGMDYKQISAGARHSAFVGENNHVWFYGSNKHGQFGERSSFEISSKTSVYCFSWFTFFLE